MRHKKFLIKEKYGLNDDDLRSILQKVDLDSFDFLNEQNDWFILKDRQLSPGIYKVSEQKLINKYYEEVVLLEQTFVIDGESKVKAVVEKAAKADRSK